MKILQETEVDLEALADMIDLIGIEPCKDVGRDESAWHISNLLHSANNITKGNHTYHHGEPSKGIMSLGRIWESVADVWLQTWAEANHGRYINNVSMRRDGIVASLDGLLFIPDTVVSETKLRFTMRRDKPQYQIHQTQCYCYMAGVKKVMFTVLHVSNSPPEVEAVMTLIEYADRELEDIWQMVNNTKQYLESIGEGPNKEGS